MAAEKRIFRDGFEDDMDAISNMSDADLDRLMGGESPTEESRDFEALETGTRVKGIVVGIQGDEILVELDGKTLGVIDAKEFDGDEPIPPEGAPVQAEYVQYDSSREVHVLSTKTVRTEVAWEELQVGMIVEGIVTGTNKGGLDLDIKGVRAFMPISQIERERVEDTNPYVGRKFTCEVTRIDRKDRNLVLSRRTILDREHEKTRGKALAKIQEGSVVKGRITRLSEHGAFIDVGGVDGLLHASKIRDRFGTKESDSPLKVGQAIEVEIFRVDLDRGRIGLNFIAVEENPWSDIISEYAEGDIVSGWISARRKDGLVLSLDEGIQALIPNHLLEKLPESDVGAIVKARIASIDQEGRQVIVHPTN